MKGIIIVLKINAQLKGQEPALPIKNVLMHRAQND